MKYLIRKERVKHERRQLDELRCKGEEGGKEWYRFLQGRGRNDDCVDEIVVENQRICGSKEIAHAVKEFWEE